MLHMYLKRNPTTGSLRVNPRGGQHRRGVREPRLVERSCPGGWCQLDVGKRRGNLGMSFFPFRRFSPFWLGISVVKIALVFFSSEKKKRC